ncbi:hypothetical protein PVAP13_J683603 [Panicum virgatum]|nr:hypothetical protein PVAP13_J683603 [Panicum virgatum]
MDVRCDLCGRNFSDLVQNFQAHLRDKKPGRAQEAAANGCHQCEHRLGRMPLSSSSAGPSTRTSTRRSTGPISGTSTMSQDNEPLTMPSIDKNFIWSPHDRDALIDLFSSFKNRKGRLPNTSEIRKIITHAVFQDQRCYEDGRVLNKVKSLKRQGKDLHKKRRRLTPSESRLYERLNQIWPA